MQTLRKPPMRGVRRLWHRAMGTKRLKQDGVVLSTSSDVVPETVRRGIFGGVYEAAESALVRACVKPGDRVLEIGAGTGFISLPCAKACGACAVTSFEANRDLEAIIRGNHALNDLHPTPIMKAVTTDGGPLVFHMADNLVSSSVHDRGLRGSRVEVEGVAIADVPADLKPTVIVMDAEGAETDLLTATDLPGVDRIVVELHPHVVGAAAISRMLDKLGASGFEIVEGLEGNVLLSRGRGHAASGDHPGSPFPSAT